MIRQVCNEIIGFGNALLPNGKQIMNLNNDGPFDFFSHVSLALTQLVVWPVGLFTMNN